jgi:hypothetical protein
MLLARIGQTKLSNKYARIFLSKMDFDGLIREQEKVQIANVIDTSIKDFFPGVI